MYQIKKFDSSLERRIIIGMIVSEEFLPNAQAMFRPELFRVPALATAAQWCLSYWAEFGTAPAHHFQDIYDSKVRAGEVPEEYTEEFDSVFSTLSKEFIDSPNLNVNYLVKQMERLMRARSLLALGEDLVATSSQEQIEEAELLLADFKPIKREGINWSDPYNLSEDQIAAASKDSDVLFNFPGVFGDVVGPVERGSFIAIQAPEKRGKSWFLQEFAIKGLLERCNVAFFSVGDMSDVQIWRRFFGRYLGTSKKYSGKTVKVPVPDCFLCQSGECKDHGVDDNPEVCSSDGKAIVEYDPSIPYTPCALAGRVTGRCEQCIPTVWYKMEKLPIFDEHLGAAILKQRTKPFAGKTMRIQCYPSLQANVKTIKTMLDIWEKTDGWIADMVIIDYADILAPEDERERETRHRINTTWASLRGLSMEKNIAVITATQSSRASYSREIQVMEDVSEDKRKLSHVTTMLILNQTPEQKKRKLMLVSNLLRRDEDFNSRETVTCAQSLEKSKPILFSFLTPQPVKGEKKL